MPHYKSVGGNLVPMEKYLADEAEKVAKATKEVSKEEAPVVKKKATTKKKTTKKA
jgi:hypothetical protein